MKTSPPGGFLRKDSNPALRARLEGSIQKAQMMRLELCGVNALRVASEGDGGFSFHGPYRLEDKPGRAEIWQETLERGGRLHTLPSSLEHLAHIGVHRFSWLRPNEEVAPHAEGEWPNGGFAFFYDNPEFACVFRISRVLPRSLVNLARLKTAARPEATEPSSDRGEIEVTARVKPLRTLPEAGVAYRQPSLADTRGAASDGRLLEEVVVATAKMTQNGNVFGRAKSAQDDTELCGWRREEMRTTVRFNISSSHRQAPVV